MTPETIKALRTELGLTQKTLAQLVGRHVRQVQNWESGHSKISRTSWTKLLEVCAALDPGKASG